MLGKWRTGHCLAQGFKTMPTRRSRVGIRCLSRSQTSIGTIGWRRWREGLLLVARRQSNLKCWQWIDYFSFPSRGRWGSNTHCIGKSVGLSFPQSPSPILAPPTAIASLRYILLSRRWLRLSHHTNSCGSYTTTSHQGRGRRIWCPSSWSSWKWTWRLPTCLKLNFFLGIDHSHPFSRSLHTQHSRPWSDCTFCIASNNIPRKRHSSWGCSSRSERLWNKLRFEEYGQQCRMCSCWGIGRQYIQPDTCSR